MKINAILEQIDLGNYALPEFQRGYVWNRDQVRRLITSLYKGYPIGGILTWLTHTDPDIARGDNPKSSGTVNLILDGQQRITTLYGIIKGKKPPFFDGDEKAFMGLFFNVENEVFEFYFQSKMQNDPHWINVTDLMKAGAGNYVENNPHLIRYLSKLNAISNIKEVDLPVQEVAGEDKTVDVVVEIFNNVNSGGTKLSKGDLALAKLCAQWTEARQELRSILDYFKKQGFTFSMDWLLRCVTIYLTGQPYFTHLSDIPTEEFQKALVNTKWMVGIILDQIGSRLGLDHDRVLQSKFAIPVIIQLMKDAGGNIDDHNEWNKVLYWYIHSFLWGRYSASTESTLASDLNILEEGEGIEGLITNLRRSRGDLRIRPENFNSWSTGARFYPFIYLMTRVHSCVDWHSGVELKQFLLGKSSSLEIHHIFPKNLLYKAGYDKAQVNNIANFTFLTKSTNIQISNKNPADYLPMVLEKYPDALSSHWIPMETRLWNIDYYLDFIRERQHLLAKAANEFLDKLYYSDTPGTLVVHRDETADHKMIDSAKDITLSDHDEEEIILEIALWMEEKGLKPGELHYNLTDEQGNLLAIFDIAWPDGVQTGLTEPLALLMNEPSEVYHEASRQGFKYFDNPEEFKEYIERHYLF